MSITFQKSDDPNEIEFTLQDINLSLVNAIRRVILSDFPTVGFNTDDYLNSDLKVITNTSSINIEYILHRLGLVPIHISNLKSFSPSKYKFTIDKQNTTNSIISVKSNDIKVFNLETGKDEDSNKFFPPDPITKDYILILKLKQNPNKIGEKLHVEGTASIGTGSINARYSPVSCAAFNNKIDEEKKQGALEKYLSKTLSSEEKKDSEKVKKTTLNFNLTYGERFFHTDENDNPNVFEMKIDSIGVFEPSRILFESLDIIKTKVDNNIKIINSIISEQADSDIIKISKSRETMESFEIQINDEGHTLGNLIQSYASLLFSQEKLPYIGYKNPHPLKKHIIVKLRTENNTLEEVNTILTETGKAITETIDALQKQIK